jgi:glycosyltransferase involved in cell wall biosynthesis
MPTVSVVIPNHNGARYVEQAVASVQRQAGVDLEIIVVDDGSSDESPAILSRLAADDPRIRLVRNTRAKGVSGARNTGQGLAGGAWIVYLDVDDVLEDGALAALLAAAAAQPDCDLVVADMRKIDAAGNLTSADWFTGDPPIAAALPAFAVDGGYLIADPLRFFLTVRFLRVIGNALIRPSLIQRAGGFDERMSHAEDTEFSCRLALHGRLFFAPRSVLQYRVHDTSASMQSAAMVEWRVRCMRALYDAADFADYRGELRVSLRHALQQAIGHYRTQGDFRTALRHAWAGVRLAPGSGRFWRDLLACLLHRA